MNENSPSQEREFNIIADDLLRYEETRMKLLSELRDILDRLKPNDAPLKDDTMCKMPDPAPGLLYRLKERVRRIDSANEELATIISKFNSLF